MESLDRNVINNFEGVAELPRRCDRLTFDEPWQCRAFGMVLAMAEDKRFPYEDFRQSLIATIGDWESEHKLDDKSWEYYEQWLCAFESLVVARQYVTTAELDKRTEEFLSGERKETI